jgi:hypothetical protein
MKRTFGLSRIPRPSATMVVAFIALFIAATGFAVGAIPARNDAIHACFKTRNGALSILKGTKCPKGSRSLSWSQQGPKGSSGRNGAAGAAGAKGANGGQGPQGAKGDAGTAGTAAAYARVALDGSLEPGDSGRQNKNIIAVDVEHDVTTGEGHYCFGGLPFGVASAMVSPDSAGDINGNVITSVAVQRGVTLGSCDAAHQQARVTTLVAGTPKDHRFQIWFEATGAAQIAAGPGGD